MRTHWLYSSLLRPQESFMTCSPTEESLQMKGGSQAQRRSAALPAALRVPADLGHPWTSAPGFSALRKAFATSRATSIAQDLSPPPTVRLPRVHIPPNQLSLHYSHSSQIITILPRRTCQALGRWSKKQSGSPLVWIKSIISSQPDVRTRLPQSPLLVRGKRINTARRPRPTYRATSTFQREYCTFI